MKRIALLVVLGIMLSLAASAQSDDCNGICEVGHDAGLTPQHCWDLLIHGNGGHVGKCDNFATGQDGQEVKGPGSCEIWSDYWNTNVGCTSSGAGGSCHVEGRITCGLGGNRRNYSYNFGCSQGSGGVPRGSGSASGASCSNGPGGTAVQVYCSGGAGGAVMSTCVPPSLCSAVALNPD